MAGSKRMSKEEKCKAILDIYHQKKEVFTEKEIVQSAAKAGINSNTILDINQSLVDDGLVDKEKIGGSNYFWSFPAKKDRQMQLQHESLLREIVALKESTARAAVALADAKRGREEGDDDDGTAPTRAAKLAKLAALEAEKIAIQRELSSLAENDPQALADLQKELELTRQAAHRWTDNIFNCKAYLVKKRGMDKKEACKLLQITSAFDYPEDKIPK